jgi:DNA topoisomerase-3
MEREQIQKLLATGKTDLLHRFISRKGRPFSAFLVRGPDGSVRFEFAPRAGKPMEAPPAAKPTEAKAAKSAQKKEPKGKTARGRAAKTKRAA